MRSLVVDFSVFEYDDFMHVSYSAESMGDDENRFADHKLIEGLLDFLFAFGIQ